MDWLRKGKTHIIAKFHRTDLVIESHSREGKPPSYSRINTVSSYLAIRHDFSLSIKYIKYVNQSVNTGFKNEIWELLGHEKIPETYMLATLLTGNVYLFNGKKDFLNIRYQQLKLYQNF